MALGFAVSRCGVIPTMSAELVSVQSGGFVPPDGDVARLMSPVLSDPGGSRSYVVVDRVGRAVRSRLRFAPVRTMRLPVPETWSRLTYARSY
jgi:hypothetical protein